MASSLRIRDEETEKKHQSFTYADPKKFKREMMFLKQDIQKAQADQDTTLVERLIAAQNKATNTAQALKAGLSQEEADQYANREANISSRAYTNRNTQQGGAGLRRNEEGEKNYDSLTYSDPNKLNREMMFLQQDIRAAQADRDTFRFDQLKSKLDRANYTIQGLNAGMTPDEAQQYGSRQASIATTTSANRNTPQGGAAFGVASANQNATSANRNTPQGGAAFGVASSNQNTNSSNNKPTNNANLMATNNLDRKYDRGPQQTQGTKPGDIKIGPGGLPPEFRNQGNTTPPAEMPKLGPGTDTESARRIVPEQFSGQGNITIPADFKPGVIMPTETERQEMENNPNFIKGLPAGLNPAGTPSAAWNASQSPQQPNSRPILSPLTGTPPPKWDGSSRGPESLRYLEWLRANPDGGKPGRPGTISGTPRPGDPLYSQDWKGNKPTTPQAGGSQWQNGTVGPTNTAWTGYGNPPRPVPTPPWMGGDNPYTPEIEPPNNRPQMQRPSVGADYAVTSVTPEYNYTDPKKFKKEMLNLKQDIREAQADGDTDKLNRLIDKQNRANYTVQGLNAGLSQEEAARYAKREADIDAKAKAKGGAGGRIEEPGTVERRQQDKPRNQEARQNTLDRAEAQRLANGTPAEQAKYDQLKRAGQLPGQDGEPITPIADPVDRGGRTRKPIVDTYENLGISGGGSQVQQPRDGGGFRTADFKDKNGNGTDDRDEGNRMGSGGKGGGQQKPPEPGQKGPGRGSGGGGGRGGGGAKPRETAKERNARMEAEADKQRDRLERKIAAGYDPATNKWSTPKSPSRLPEKGKSSFPDKNNPTPSKPNSSGNVHSSKAAGGKGWQGYADDWTAEANRLRKLGDLKGAAEAEKAAKQYSSYKEGDNPYASIPTLSDKNKPSSPSNSGEVNANGGINIGTPNTSVNPNVTYTPGSPQASNGGGWNNGGGMGGGQGGGGGGGNSGSGGRFVTIDGKIKYFA